MRHRLFVGILFSRSFQEKLTHWIKENIRIPVRPTLNNQFHITLAPPFYERDILPLEERLKSIRGVGHFLIRFHRVTYGPYPKSPRLIWAEGDSPKPIMSLKSKIFDALYQNNESRHEFKLHMTLARFTKMSEKMWRNIPLNSAVDWEETITAFHLIESRLTPQGAHYKVLTTVPLTL